MQHTSRALTAVRIVVMVPGSSAGIHACIGSTTCARDKHLHFLQGNLEEVSACNIFAVKGNEIRTPPLSGTILHGITRDR